MASAPEADRIDGWKSIGAYFGRDRTTAIRWARERDMPVRRIPGGKNATVYALRHELDQWAHGVAEVAPAEVEAAVAPLPAPALRKPRRWIGWAAGVALAGGSLGALTLTLPMRSPAPAATETPVALPASAQAADLFLKGRDLLADRKSESIERAIRLLRDVTRREPGYGPGYAALAEALLLSREFGVRSDSSAFTEARVAVQDALRLAPDLASAHRVMGFIAYWWDRDIATARRLFERAIALAPDDPTGQFWYGNVLADHGESADALRYLNAARMMQPGSVAIQTDLAWARWSSGDRAGALAMLTDLAQRHPDFAVIHDCLSIIHLSEGDYAGYAASLSRFAALRNSPTLRARAEAVRIALTKGRDEVHRVLIAGALADIAAGEVRTHTNAAFIASIARDRGQLHAILQRAAQRQERWGDAGLVRDMQWRWQGDAEILGMLAGVSVA
jgi:tetratricopeptide (TPR) repeat protein